MSNRETPRSRIESALTEVALAAEPKEWTAEPSAWVERGMASVRATPASQTTEFSTLVCTWGTGNFCRPKNRVLLKFDHTGNGLEELSSHLIKMTDISAGNKLKRRVKPRASFLPPVCFDDETSWASARAKSALVEEF